MSNTINSKEPDEDRLVARLQRGSEEAFFVLVQQYQQRLYKTAYGITLEREESLDIVQEVFLKVHRYIGSFKKDSNLYTWLHRMTVNESLNWIRKMKRRFKWLHRPVESEDDNDFIYPELGSEDYAPEKLFQDKEMKTVLFDQMKKLPEDARAIFMLREIDGLSYDEIADILKIKRGTVSSRIFYARKRLKENLAGYFDQPA